VEWSGVDGVMGSFLETHFILKNVMFNVGYL